VPKNDGKIRCEKITTSDLGSMFLLYDTALIARSSNSILFFKVDEETKLWKQYHKIDKIRGNIFFIRGNVRFQIIGDDKIYFYIVDQETLMPELENVMNNFMNCSMMMIGRFVRFAITYKTNQTGFTIYTRSFYHNFKVTVDKNSHEGAQGLNLSKLDKYAIGQGRKVTLYDQKSFKVFDQLKIENVDEDPSLDDPKLEIVYMVTGPTQKRIGVSLGKRILRNEIKITHIIIFKREENNMDFKQFKVCRFVFDDVCSQF
jgi:hypothetical protein